ncbi:hypothetical protein BaRGS_00021057, partial [Batillaria attramentaria]
SHSKKTATHRNSPSFSKLTTLPAFPAQLRLAAPRAKEAERRRNPLVTDDADRIQLASTACSPSDAKIQPRLTTDHR